MHAGEPGTQGIALVDTHLMHVVAVTRDQGAETGQPARAIEHVSLFIGPDRDNPFPATLGPACLEHKMVAPVGKARLELHGFFPAQAKGLLQFQAHGGRVRSGPCPVAIW